MTEKGNRDVPTIRFNGFEAGWNSVVMSKIGQPYTGLTGKTKADFGHGRGRYVTYMGVFSNPISNSSMTDPIPIDRSQNEVKKGDIFFTISSETPSDVGMSSVWMDDLENVYLNSFCFGFRPAPYLCSEFLAYMFRADEFRKKIIVLAQGISRYNISRTKALDIRVSVPECNEQQKIGAYFRGLDSLLSMHQRKHDKLVTLKKAMLQKMFPQPGATTPEIRFKGFSGEWVNHEFKLIASRSTQSASDARLPRIEYEDILSESGCLNKDVFKKASSKIGLNFDRGDVLFGKLRPYLKNWWLAEFAGIAVGDFWVLQPAEATSELIYCLIQTEAFERVANQSSGSKMPRSDWKLVSGSAFRIPVQIEEQQKIGTYFRTLDALIAQHATQLQKLQQIKSACLEKMFV